MLTAAMAVMCAQAQTPGPNAEICKFYNNKTAAVSLTYDDGMLEHYTLVAPELEKRGLRGTFWINGNIVGSAETPNGPRLTWDNIKEMHERGHEMTSHTWSHPNCRKVGFEAFMADVARNDSAFMEHLGYKPMTLAYPFNAMTAAVVKAVEEGRIGSRTFQTGHGQQNNKQDIGKMTQWLNALIEKGEWGVTMTHGIKVGYDKWYKPEELWMFYDTLKANGEKVWTAVFADVQSYVKEREATTLEIRKQSAKKLVLRPVMTLDAAIYRHPLTINITNIAPGREVTAGQDGRTLTVMQCDGNTLVNIMPSGGDVTVRIK